MQDAIDSEQVWHYADVPTKVCGDVAGATYLALQRPEDFPPLRSAIVGGDHVVLAIDPNVPEIQLVVRGVVRALGETEAGQIDVLLWDEATEQTIDSIASELSPTSRVAAHVSSDRRELGYLAADASGDPIYLNRMLVEADFVLPIVLSRPLAPQKQDCVTGIFPGLADSAARIREADRAPSDENKQKTQAVAPEATWLLGVQFMLCVAGNQSGGVSDVFGGTIDAIRKRLRVVDTPVDDFPPPAPLVVASIDGDAQQQTWHNVARAAVAASHHVTAGGTIVVWTQIQTPPAGQLIGLADRDGDADFGAADATWDAIDESSSGGPSDSGDDFPRWDDSVWPARQIASVIAEYRVLIHSGVDRDAIESMGLGALDGVGGLRHLSRSFSTCGILRAAQM